MAGGIHTTSGSAAVLRSCGAAKEEHGNDNGLVSMSMNSAANAQQVEYWNGPVGERWARLQESIDLHLGEITEALIDFAAPKPGERVLDVGCGCGTTTLLLAMKTRPEGSVGAIDISVPMLNVARARAMAQNADIAFVQ